MTLRTEYQSDCSLRDTFFDPIAAALRDSAHTRQCSTMSDSDFIRSCCLRVNGLARSGRGHLQNMFNHGILDISRQTTEANISSARRLRMLKDVNASLLSQLKVHQEDALAHIPELENIDVHAADGHFHACSLRDLPIAGKKRPPEHFYSLNLRSYGMTHLTQAQIGGVKNKKREHDMSAMKRLDVETLRQGAMKGRKVLYVYDRAIINFSLWTKWKMRSGIYVITREKSNMKLEVIGLSDWDADDSVNAGVLADEIVGSASTAAIRRITYVSPENGEKLHFLTNNFDLRPGVVAYLYKRRWDIEKVFDEIKNKFSEHASWSKKAIGKDMQALSIVLHHNLIRLFEQHIDMNAVQKEDRKRAHSRLEKVKQSLAEKGKTITSLRLTGAVITQHSLKFIRWLRASLEGNWLLDQARERLYALLRATF